MCKPTGDIRIERRPATKGEPVRCAGPRAVVTECKPTGRTQMVSRAYHEEQKQLMWGTREAKRLLYEARWPRGLKLRAQCTASVIIELQCGSRASAQARRATKVAGQSQREEMSRLQSETRVDQRDIKRSLRVVLTMG